MPEWYTFNDQMNEMFGGKVWRLSLSAGCTCPNRDGKLSSGGCIFCSAGGSGDFASAGDLPAQIEAAKQQVSRKIGKHTKFAGYMAYFQSFTNTYGDTDRLTCLFEQAAALPEIVSLAIATRPDCISDEMIDRLRMINEQKPVFIELGLQTMHEDTAAYINRCYPLPVFEDAFMRLKAAGLRVVAHVIIGLPGEDAQRTRETVRYLCALRYPGKIASDHAGSAGIDSGPGQVDFDTGNNASDSCDNNSDSCDNDSGCAGQNVLDGIKLQLLYVLKGTPLAALLPEHPDILQQDPGAMPAGYLILKDGMHLPQYTLPEYADLICELTGMLPAGTALHRITGDPPKKDLILPQWTADKKHVLNTIRARAVR